MSAHGDFVPDSPQNLHDWSDNYITELAGVTAHVTWPAANSTALTAALTAVRDAAKAVLDAQNVLQSKMGLLQSARVTNLPVIRQSTKNLKSSAGFNTGDAQTLQVTTSATALDPANYRPQLRAESFPGYNVLTGKKRGVQALNIYMRLKGTNSWTLIAARRTSFPFHDDTPPAVPGKPEEREYMAMGVMNDEEIGQPSDIVSAVFRSM